MATSSGNSFGARADLTAGGRSYEVFRLDAVPGVMRLPYSLKVLLENMLRNEDGVSVNPADIEALAGWDAEPSRAKRSLSRRPASSCRTSPGSHQSSTWRPCATP